MRPAAEATLSNWSDQDLAQITHDLGSGSGNPEPCTSSTTGASGTDVSFGQAVSDISSEFRVPDYVSVDLDLNLIPIGVIPIGDLPIPIGAGCGVIVSDTRYGGVFIAPIGSVGTSGPTGQIRAGWIESYSTPSRDQVNKFLRGWSGGVSLISPPFAAAWTWGNPPHGGFGSFAFEIGAGFPVGASIAAGYGFHALDDGLRWS
jgi:hypothetical protein